MVAMNEKVNGLIQILEYFKGFRVFISEYNINIICSFIGITFM